MDLYETNDYRQYLNWKLNTQLGRGARSRFAEHLGIQLSFVSRVLSLQQHLSPEHCYRAADFLSLQEVDTEHLLLLLYFARASTKDLAEHYEKRIKQSQKRRQQIRSRVKSDRSAGIDLEGMSQYYGAWYHTAVHMYLRNPDYQDPTKIARALRLSDQHVTQSIQLLQDLGFIELNTKGKGWTVRDQRFHFSAKSPALRSHHINWRQNAARSIDEGRSSDLHYSLVLSVDSRAASRIKEQILELVEKVHAEIEPAPDREVHALTLDFLRVGDVK